MKTYEIIDTIKFEYVKNLSSIVPTTTDHMQFARNVKADYWASMLNGRIDTIDKHLGFIGKNVYQFGNNITFADQDEYDKMDRFQKKMNSMSSESVFFGETEFDVFLAGYINYQINRLTEDLTTMLLHHNSTNPFSNIKYHIRIEVVQEVLRFHKYLLTL